MVVPPKRAPTTVSVQPQRGGLQLGSGVGNQFHRLPQNSIHIGGHANSGAPTVISVGPNELKPPSTTVSLPKQIRSGIDDSLDEDY